MTTELSLDLAKIANFSSTNLRDLEEGKLALLQIRHERGRFRLALDRYLKLIGTVELFSEDCLILASRGYPNAAAKVNALAAHAHAKAAVYLIQVTDNGCTVEKIK